jgi:hypothetical protein
VFSSSGELLKTTALFDPAPRYTLVAAAAAISGIAGDGSVVSSGYRTPPVKDAQGFTVDYGDDVLTLTRFDASGSVAWGPVEYSRSSAFVPGTYAISPKLALDGSIFVIKNWRATTSGAWFSPSGAQLTGFQPVGAYDFVSPETYASAPLADGRVALLHIDASRHTDRQTWFLATAPPATPGSEWQSSPVPGWLASSPETRVFLLPNGRGYAVADAPEVPPAPCAPQIDVRSISGELCATVTFKVSDAACTSVGALSVGLDGTVIQQVHANDAGVACDGGTCPCVRRWWPKLLK